MKLQLDTTSKTIKIEQDVLLSKLIETLDSILPNKEWKKYTLETATVIEHWHSPTVIREYVPRPAYPWWGAPITYMSSNREDHLMAVKASAVDTNYSLKSGVFNVEVKA